MESAASRPTGLNVLVSHPFLQETHVDGWLGQDPSPSSEVGVSGYAVSPPFIFLLFLLACVHTILYFQVCV